MAQEMYQVQQEGNFNKISYRPPLQASTPPTARDYEALESRTRILNEIMLALKDDNMYKFGVFGMGGVGKSTLIEELAWRAEQDGSFGTVVKANVTNSPVVKRIQGEIAEMLGLKFIEETEVGRASRLRERIKEEKNILVILDDIWQMIDLTKVGVPFGDDHRGCKLLLTSRELNVLKSDMGTQIEFQLDVLSKGESWSLFKKMVGDVDLHPIAMEVAEACAGLPLMITVVAKALKNKGLDAWKDALTRFSNKEQPDKVYSAIELSYNNLANDELKSLFLLLGSFGQTSIWTRYLLIYFWGLGLHKYVDTLANARNRLYSLLWDLKSSCLLLEAGEEEESVKMHDVVHEVASKIASKDRPIFAVKIGGELKEWPQMEWLNKCYRIFLPDCRIHELPRSLECSKLEILVLVSRNNYLKLHDEFFSGMIALKVLYLGGMDCTPSLPASLCKLTNLRTLYLRECILEDMAPVATLTNLEILGLEMSNIRELPAVIGQLAHLRLLDLRFCSELRAIPAKLISSLTRLEELYMDATHIEWEVEGSKNHSHNASLDELRHLNKLKALGVHIEDASILPKDLATFQNLERYRIYIGNVRKRWPWFWNTPRTLVLGYNNMTSSIHLDHGVKYLLDSVQELQLYELKGVSDVLYQLNGKGFPQLKRIQIQNSMQIQYIIESKEWHHSRQAFPNLESLVLHNLPNMKKICNCLLPIQSFAKLKVIKVKGCHSLESLLSHSVAGGLSQLHELEISECKIMSEIIVGGDTQSNKIEFPRLSSLTLDCLPMLGSFFSQSLTTDMESTSATDYNDDLSIPGMLFDEKVAMPNLETMKLSSINMIKLWDNISVPSCIQNLTSLTVADCSSLTYLFSCEAGRALVKLRYLEITNCRMMEEIFMQEEKLGNVTAALNPLSYEKVTFPNLETLVISHMDNLKSIWNNELVPNPFPKMTKMEVSFCQSLNHVFPLFVAMKLRKLQVLDTRDCGVESIVAMGEKPKEVPSFVFPQLTSLTFWRLEKIRSFYPGIHIFDCPIIRKLDVYHCSNLEVFRSKSQKCHQEVVPYHGQPLFAFEEVIPSVEELSLSSNDVINFCNGEHRVDDFHTIKALSLQCFHDESDEFPMDFLQRFTNLENLKVACSSFIEIFSSENIGRVMKLKTLRLNGLDKLEYLCKDKPEIQPILRNLETLEVHWCSGLKNIAPSTSSLVFQNLDKLWVGYCSGLVNLITPSLARSLPKLRNLWIYNCEMVEEIVASETDADVDEIAFMKLEHLQLENLPRLTSFCNGNCSFRFPLLERLYVMKCPKMETFSHGNMSTPNLRKLLVTPRGDDEWHWEGDLNTTIRKIFSEKESNED